MGEGRGRDGSRGRMGRFGPQLCIFLLVFTFFGCTIVISVSKVLMGRLAVSESVLNIINYDISGRLWPHPQTTVQTTEIRVYINHLGHTRFHNEFGGCEIALKSTSL